jgi:hypothetical protein
MLDSLFMVKGNGPILITGPHSVKTIRHKKKIHVREEYIYDIICKLYKSLGPKLCTVMTWNVDFIEDHNLFPGDPNFVTNIEKSVWFKQLKMFKQTRPKFYLHLDLHGMHNDSTKNHIEIGMKAVQLHRPGLSQHMKPIIIKSFDHLNVPYSFNSKFQGFSMNKYTVANQGVLLGFFSIQLEISKDIRKRMKTDTRFIKKFANGIKNIYAFWKKEMKKPKHKTKKIKRGRRKFTKKKIKGGGKRCGRTRKKSGGMRDIQIQQDELFCIYRIAALQHAGVSWTNIRMILDGQFRTHLGSYQYRPLCELDRDTFNGLLQLLDMSDTPKEGTDAFEKKFVREHLDERNNRVAAIREFKNFKSRLNMGKPIFSEKNLRKKRAKPLKTQIAKDSTGEKTEKQKAKTEKQKLRDKEWEEYFKLKKEYEKKERKENEHFQKYHKASNDPENPSIITCINCGMPYYKFGYETWRKIRYGDKIIDAKCEVCKQSMFKLTVKEKKWFEEIMLDITIKNDVAKRKMDEKNCPISLLPFHDIPCEERGQEPVDRIVVESRWRRTIRDIRERARGFGERMRNNRCTIMGGGKRNTGRSKKTRKKYRK